MVSGTEAVGPKVPGGTPGEKTTTRGAIKGGGRNGGCIFFFLPQCHIYVSLPASQTSETAGEKIEAQQQVKKEPSKKRFHTSSHLASAVIAYKALFLCVCVSFFI